MSDNLCKILAIKMAEEQLYRLREFYINLAYVLVFDIMTEPSGTNKQDLLNKSKDYREKCKQLTEIHSRYKLRTVEMLDV